MPKNYPRANRVEKLAQMVLGEAILDLKDPRVGFATVTTVRMSRDLRVAEVFVSAMGSEEEQSQTIAAIKHATPHLRSVLGQQVRMRRLPEVKIVEDLTAQTVARMEELLRASGAPKEPEAEAEEYEPDDEDDEH
ncbi:MAG: 30S ribosome-binding factor RbfA [Actinomycetota bacterium]